MLEKVFDEVVLVNVLDSGDSAHLALMKRPELGVTLTKLHCWELTQFSKCVFMDADTMVRGHVSWHLLVTWDGGRCILFFWAVFGAVGGRGCCCCAVWFLFVFKRRGNTGLFGLVTLKYM